MFETERLKFEITDEGDVGDLQECLNDTDMCDAVSFLSYPYSEDDAKKWVQKSQAGLQDKTEWFFSVRLKDNGKYIGSINLHKKSVSLDEDVMDQAEIGYWVNKSCWKKGYGTEMLQGAIKYGFENLSLEAIYAVTALDNLSSMKVLEKNGFQRQEDIETNYPDGGKRQSAHYIINNQRVS